MSTEKVCFSKVLTLRHSFERDLVRHKGYGAFVLRGIIGLCLVCGEDFDKRRSNEITCSPECKRVRANERQKAYDTRVATERNEKRRTKYAGYVPEKDGVVTPDPYTNLMLAMVQNAADEGDTGWLEENQDVYTQAILGRRLDA